MGFGTLWLWPLFIISRNLAFISTVWSIMWNINKDLPIRLPGWARGGARFRCGQGGQPSWGWWGDRAWTQARVSPSARHRENHGSGHWWFDRWWGVGSCRARGAGCRSGRGGSWCRTGRPTADGERTPSVGEHYRAEGSRGAGNPWWECVVGGECLYRRKRAGSLLQAGPVLRGCLRCRRGDPETIKKTYGYNSSQSISSVPNTTPHMTHTTI